MRVLQGQSIYYIGTWTLIPYTPYTLMEPLKPPLEEPLQEALEHGPVGKPSQTPKPLNLKP